MYRRAAPHPKPPALWRATPLARCATSLRFSAPRRTIPRPRHQSAGPTGYSANTILSRPFTTIEPMDGPSLDPIRSHMTCNEFVDSVWGFVVYRCAGTDESAWKRMLQHINDSVHENLKYYGQEDLLKHHDLHVANERPSQESHGETARQVRDHFNSWVPKSLAGRLPRDSAIKIDDLNWNRATFTPRYEYCLFVDSLCLESLDQSGMYYPVVKLLNRNWTDDLNPQERQSAVVYPEFHDGVTEYYDEDVGWMYMPVTEYVTRYARLHDFMHAWDTLYVRPPYIFGFEEEEELVGAWRRG